MEQSQNTHLDLWIPGKVDMKICIMGKYFKTYHMNTHYKDLSILTEKNRSKVFNQ